MNSFFRAAAAALFLMLTAGCGLPSYSYLDAPTKISYSSNKVGFNAADDSDVDGYIIYYKFYPYNDTEIDDDEDEFDASYYDDDSIPNGTTVPVSLGFTKMAWADASSITTPLISYEGSGSVAFDFASSQNLSDSAVNDPVLYIEDIDMTSSMGTPGRGVKGSDSLYKHFVKDYDFDDSDLDSSVTSSTWIHIAFVAISYGLDASTLETSMSVPVHLGTIQQYNFNETED